MSEAIHNAAWFFGGAFLAVWLIVAALICVVEMIVSRVLTWPKALKTLTWPWLVVKHWTEVE